MNPQAALKHCSQVLVKAGYEANDDWGSVSLNNWLCDKNRLRNNRDNIANSLSP